MASATMQLYGYVMFHENRFGRRPRTFIISERTVRNLAIESEPEPQLMPAFVTNETRIHRFIESARIGAATFCGIPIEVMRNNLSPA